MKFYKSVSRRPIPFTGQELSVIGVRLSFRGEGEYEKLLLDIFAIYLTICTNLLKFSCDSTAAGAGFIALIHLSKIRQKNFPTASGDVVWGLGEVKEKLEIGYPEFPEEIVELIRFGCDRGFQHAEQIAAGPAGFAITRHSVAGSI